MGMFLAGFLIGAFLGMVLMALLVAARQQDLED